MHPQYDLIIPCIELHELVHIADYEAKFPEVIKKTPIDGTPLAPGYTPAAQIEVKGCDAELDCLRKLRAQSALERQIIRDRIIQMEANRMKHRKRYKMPGYDF